MDTDTANADHDFIGQLPLEEPNINCLNAPAYKRDGSHQKCVNGKTEAEGKTTANKPPKD